MRVLVACEYNGRVRDAFLALTTSFWRNLEQSMKVLVGCEYSGRVRQAFRNIGHDAWSCDLLESEDGSPFHIHGDVIPLLTDGWDLAIFHPPCTHLAVSGSRWFAEKKAEQEEALDFVRVLMSAPIPRIAIENPVSVISSRIRKPDQIIQPWQFGHGETKATCLWLKGLKKLIPTHMGDLFSAEQPKERIHRVHLLPPSPTRWKERSRTYQGIATAMAEQWGRA